MKKGISGFAGKLKRKIDEIEASQAPQGHYND
jgi:hypothetical protein